MPQRPAHRAHPVSPLALSARAAQLLLILGGPGILPFLHCVDYVVENSSHDQSVRETINGDLFAGRGAINRAFIEDGLKSKAIDKETSGNFGDITTTEGFLRSIQLVLQVKEGGLITAGPPCGSFIFLNMFTSGRTKWSPLGNKRGYVVEANVITTRLCLLLLLAFVRLVLIAVEQPLSTLMQEFPYFKWLAGIVKHFIPWLSTSFSMAIFGHANMKPTVVFGDCPWSYRLYKKVTPAIRKRVKKSKKTVRKYSKNGRTRVSGIASVLRKSQVYPIGFGRAVRDHHMKWMKSPGSVETIRRALYRPEGGLNIDPSWKPMKAPYRWRHARLSELTDFLNSEKKAGRYHPLIQEGLD
ncbi:unnamed protein product [Cladocopium goreaui]|uniref:Uncharacterized protein n=2 Tax=Cladocopium goreaui TaxID=2562237 RepID=A0A9P1D063_9DINO|nr:unnamed protein product [Cladocopium goreaui]